MSRGRPEPWGILGPRSRPDAGFRIGDAEREAAVVALGEHFVAGRLDREEHDERTEAAYAARTNADLWRLFTDLPPLVRRPPEPAPAPQTRRRPPLGLIVVVVVGLVLLVPGPTPPGAWVLVAVLILLLRAGGQRARRQRGLESRPVTAAYTSGSRRGSRGTCS